MDDASLSPEQLVIGAENDTGLGNFGGKIDDVKIYNYARSDTDIALEYTTLKGEPACIRQDDPWLQFDIAGEPGQPSWCAVDILDFAELAAVWTRCNMVPDCLP